MARSNDKEYALRRRVKELEDKIKVLEGELKTFKEPPKRGRPKKEVIEKNGCPQCGASLSQLDMKHATLELCSKGCGYRTVKK
jgi:hypothetical protein